MKERDVHFHCWKRNISVLYEFLGLIVVAGFSRISHALGPRLPIPLSVWMCICDFVLLCTDRCLTKEPRSPAKCLTDLREMKSMTNLGYYKRRVIYEGQDLNM